MRTSEEQIEALRDLIDMQNECPDETDSINQAREHIEEAERRAEQCVRADIGRVANDVISERNRQSEVEGFSADRDDLYTDFQLSRASAVYAQITGYSNAARNAQAYIGHSQWPWDYAWLKPTTRRHDLVKAAALLVAEIERLDRKAIDAAREVG